MERTVAVWPEGLSFARVLKYNPYRNAEGEFTDAEHAVDGPVGSPTEKPADGPTPHEQDTPKAFAAPTPWGESHIAPMPREHLDTLQLKMQTSILGEEKGKIADAMTEEQRLSYVDDILTNGALKEPKMYLKYPEERNPEYEKYEKVREALMKKYGGNTSMATPEELKGLQQYMTRDPTAVGEGWWAISSRLSRESQDRLLAKHVPELDKAMPDTYKKEYDAEWGTYRLKYDSAVETRQRLNVMGDFIRKRPGAEIDVIANRVKGTTADQLNIGMFHKDRDVHMSDFWGGWTTSGGSDAQSHALLAMRDFVPGSPDLFTMPDRAGPPPSANLRAHMVQTYKETQEFFDKKFNEGKAKRVDAGEKEIKLYRGVASRDNTYVPGALESWSTQKSTGTRFANMMGGSRWDHKTGTSFKAMPKLLTTKVKIKHLFATYETLKGWFPLEKHLKGKAEHIVLGGSLKDIDIEHLPFKP